MIAVTLVIACSSAPNQASPRRDTDITDTGTLTDTLVIDSSTTSSPSTTGDTGDLDTAGGGGRGGFSHVVSASITLNGIAAQYTAMPRDQGGFYIATVEAASPGACATARIIGLYSYSLPIGMELLYLDDGESRQHSTLPHVPLGIADTNLVDENSIVYGGTVTYEVLADGSHQFDWFDASLCTPPFDPTYCQPVTVSVNVVGGLEDAGTFNIGQPGPILVNGVPRCEAYY